MNRIRNSIKAIIIRDGNLLAIYKTDPLGDYYILPGGGQHYGECINETLKREVREETTLEVRVQRLRYIRDYISRNHEFAETEKDAHQVELMFECEIVSPGQARVGETPDENQIDVRWLPLDHLMDFRLYPLSLRPLLMDLVETTQPVYLGDIN
jgi:8-oxo-dGTP diphosphatase